jgi:hypothetical protein
MIHDPDLLDQLDALPKGKRGLKAALLDRPTMSRI